MKNENMTTAAVAIIDKPLVSKRKYRDFDVPSDIFRRFDTGRNKFEHWSKYLNLEDSNQRDIYEYAKKHRNNVIILRAENTGALRSIRRRSI